MHYLPLAVDASKQKSLVSPVVYLPPVSVDGGFDLDIGNRPREIALHVCLDVTENQIKPVQRIAFGFNVMNDQIIKTFVLAATLYVTRALEVEKVLPKWCAVGRLPTALNRLHDIDERLIVGISQYTLRT
jgi:hypothetical protein